MRLDEHKREWEEIAEQDAYWAILSEPSQKFGTWDRDAFFATGAREIDAVMTRAESLDRPLGRARALDFGCGVGRLTRAMAAHFDEAVGIDISEAMVARAREANADVANCTFAANAATDLRDFPDASFDMVYTRRVLQHLPDDPTIHRYVAELVRVLAPDGLLVFQLPSHIPFVVRLQPRRRLYLALRRIGLTPGRLYWRLGLHPMRMRAMSGGAVGEMITAAGGRLIAVDTDRDAEFGFQDSVYWVGRA